jgi:UrcA family protein
MKSIKFLMAVAALSVSGFAAAGARDVNTVVVRYGDLNLESQAGVRVLHKRIRNAAKSVCKSLDSRNLGLRAAYDDCVDEAVSNGVAAVGNPGLTQLHVNKGKRAVLASN